MSLYTLEKKKVIKMQSFQYGMFMKEEKKKDENHFQQIQEITHTERRSKGLKS